MPMTQEDAGVLKLGGEELTEGAKFKFIQDVMDQLRLGSAGFNVPFLTPCGPDIPPLPPQFEVPNLHDEKAYPDWQKNACGTYLTIAQTLNIPGQTPFLPIIFDPIHVAAQLGLPMPSIKFSEFPGLMLNLPGLMLKLEIFPPDIPLKLPDIMGLLNVPPAIPIPKIPELPIPPIPGISPIDFFADLPSLAIKPIIGLPDVFLNLIGLFPVLAIDLLTLNLAPLCELALDLFASTNGPNPVLQIATSKVLAIKTAECLAINLIGVTLGSASGGAVGGLGKELGYEPPLLDDVPELSPVRKKIISFAQTMDGTSYGDPKTREKYILGLLPRRIFKNNGEPTLGKHADLDNGKRGTAGKPKSYAFTQAKSASSCGMFVRGALIAAGATENAFFDEPYRDATALQGLLETARHRGALIFDRRKGHKEVPPFKAGDFVLIGSDSNVPHPQHVELFLSDYRGGFGGGIKGIGGGFPDPKNKVPNGKGRLIGSKIKSVTYKFEKRTQDGNKDWPYAGPEDGPTDASDDITKASYLRPVIAIIDSEKMINYNKES